MNDFSHAIESNKDFNETVSSLTKKIEDNQFKVLHIHDVQATLASKGIKHSPYKIVEFCRAPAAKRVLDTDPLIGLFLPCRAIVFEKSGKIEVVAMSPKLMRQFFPKANLSDLPETIDSEIQKILGELK
jgi:uncharacterized protein (DUF302 family)